MLYSVVRGGFVANNAWQVTITTELQEDIMMSDVKYGPSAESVAESAAIAPSMDDVEKGSAEEGSGGRRVSLPPRSG